MIRIHQDRRAIRFAVCGALATALVACAGSGHLARATAGAPQSETIKSAGKLDKAVVKAEGDVANSPRDPAARIALGNAYLAAGRFDSAATTFEDAIALGDSSASTALRLALAHIGVGRNDKAVAILDQNRDAIPAGDLGLALALAGDTSHGVAILAEALRGGEDTPKLRQNLAYAYALDGRWREARLMASQDVPADQIDARLGDWAMKARPEDHQRRVAGLLGTPVRTDEGQPVELALVDRPAAPVEPRFAAAELPRPASAEAGGELPPSDPSQEFVMPEPAAPAPVERPSSPANFASAFAEPRPVVQPMVLPVPAPAAAKPATGRPVAAAKPLRTGSHFVQLGSFSSEVNARSAIKILRARNPELKNYEMKITPAVVRGKNYWRVAAAGFDQRSALGVCSRVRTRGGGCIAYSIKRPLPGAVPGRGNGGPLMARR